MTASSLLGREVVDRSGERVGAVHDIVVRRRDDGGYEMAGFVVGRSALAGRFGYGATLAPPTPLHGLLAWLRRHERYLPWEDVADIGEEVIRASVASADLTPAWRAEPR
ncbi:PRC-barrel domain-containing protein [Marinactinospora thermotolerans]|uniref:PRC-barrel domain-containing protein n=1 Tax=Marinactinospora thermotolerans TaxID=531310 RepID=UPI003D932447